MTNFKRKKVAAAAFTFLMAFSSISGATITSADTEQEEDFDVKEAEISPGNNGKHLTVPSLTMTYLNYQNLIEKYNPGLDDATRIEIYQTAQDASQKYDVPLELILAIIGCESEFKPKLRGALDDTGLMQVRFRYSSSWAKAMGIAAPKSMSALTDIETNIYMGTYILSHLFDNFHNNLEYALIGYNAGENYVNRRLAAGDELPSRYLVRVNLFYEELTKQPLMK